LLVSLSFLARRAAPKDVTEPPELRAIYRFSNPVEVELVMRVLRQWTPEDDEELQPEAVSLADLAVRVRGGACVQSKAGPRLHF